MTLRQAVQSALKTAEGIYSPDNPVVEELRAALDAPDIADELAEALRPFIAYFRKMQAHGPYADHIQVGYLDGLTVKHFKEAAQLLARYDAQKSSAASPRV